MALIGLAILGGAVQGRAVAGGDGVELFEKRVRPVLEERCVKCHGAGDVAPKGGLDVRSPAGLLTGGDSGPSIVPGDPDASPLIRAIRHADPERKMPPRGRLSPDQVAAFEEWVRQGAPSPRETASASGQGQASELPWAFRPVARPEVPALPGIESPIDAFVMANLKRKGLDPAPEADRRTLIRRLSFDLVGLPPTPEEVEAFVADPDTKAYERLVDRLLASPHYGERWGRHWLDLVRYAETHGYERDDPKPGAWRYRDWVVRSFNRDKPYDRFLSEQIAGDEVPDASAETRSATGLFRLGLIDDEPADPVADRFDQLDDMLKVVGTTMLGLTVHCARCHDHKFDPIKQADYYRMLAFFTPSRPYVRDHDESITVEVATPEQKARHAERDEAIGGQVNALEAEIEALRAPHREALVAERTRRLDKATIAALETPDDRRDAEQKRLVEAVTPDLTPKPEEIDARLPEAEKARKDDLDRQVAELNKRRPAPIPIALALTDDGPTAEPTRIMIRGDAHRPGAEVQPGFLSVIDPSPAAITPPPGGKTTGRRLALARWIARPENPLTARVMVNRLWHYHMGRGLVATPSDFGAMGEEPALPELLDWLASEFVARGWSIKAMHRLIVTSAAYRRSVRWDDAAAAADPENAWLWRRPPRRLEAEAIRDAALAVAGVLNREIGGPSVTPPIDAAVLAGQSVPGRGWGESDGRSAARRSIYVRAKRTLPLPELQVLDAPDASDPCPHRAVTTTAPQALTLLNAAFWHEQAAHLAERLRREAGDDPSAQVDRAFALVLARSPSPAERRLALDFLDAQADRIRRRRRPEDRSEPTRDALRAFCLGMLNVNEFSHAD